MTKQETEKHNKFQRLKRLYIFAHCPYDQQTSWHDVDALIEGEVGNIKLGKSYLLQEGFLNEHAEWHKDLIKYGLVLEVRYHEPDPLYGLVQTVKQTLVSDRGAAFLKKFFNLKQSLK